MIRTLLEVTVAAWQVQDAKARFSELLDATIKNGPQVVTRRGIETAILVPIQEWRRLQDSARPGLKELLIGSGPRFENLISDRRSFRRRPPVEFK
jgi:prevent-host-death family protein